MLKDHLDHPFYRWPRTLLNYRVRFHAARVQPDGLVLTENGKAIPLQLSELRLRDGYLESAVVPVGLYEYAISAVNGNGEGRRCTAIDTSPSSWRNWDPKPGELFRRRFTYNTTNYLQVGQEEPGPRYYPH